MLLQEGQKGKGFLLLVSMENIKPQAPLLVQISSSNMSCLLPHKGGRKNPSYRGGFFRKGTVFLGRGPSLLNMV